MNAWRDVTSGPNFSGGLAPAVLAAAVLLFSGCGGSSQSEMMRLAQLRSQINAQSGQNTRTAEADKPAPVDEEPVAKEPAQESAPQSPAAVQPIVSRSAAPRPVTQPSAPPAAQEQAAAPAPAQAGNDPVDESSRNLADIAEALYAAATQSGAKEYLTTLDRDREGKLSWRVRLLPYLGYRDLYKQFSRDQDWDSPKNKQLLDQMPDVYRCEGLPSNTHTRFQAVVGVGSVMGGRRGVRSDALSDRAADVVLVVETGSSTGVPWTKPDEFDFTTPGALRSLGRLRGGYTYAAWADGTVAALDMSKPKRLLSSVFSYRGDPSPGRAAVTAPFDAERMAIGSAPSGSTAIASAAPRSAAPGAAPRTPPGSAAYAPAGYAPSGYSASPSGLATSCLAAARQASESQAATDAWSWLYSGVVAELPAESWSDEMKWTKALRRPTLGLHWAVGATHPTAGEHGSATRHDPKAESAAERRRLFDATDPLGEPLLQTVEKAAKASQPGALKPADPSAGPLISYLPPAQSIADLLTDADERGADVLLVLDVDATARGRSKSIEPILYDVGRRAQLKRLGKLTTRTDREQDRRADSLQKARWELSDYIEDELTPGEWPVRLTAEMAAKRVRGLGRSPSGYPPRKLIEMRYYRSLNLVDDAQLLQAVNALLGDDQGVNLLLGNDSKRRRVVRQWLPHDDPAEYLASLERQRRRDDDNE